MSELRLLPNEGNRLSPQHVRVFTARYTRVVGLNGSVALSWYVMLQMPESVRDSCRSVGIALMFPNKQTFLLQSVQNVFLTCVLGFWV